MRSLYSGGDPSFPSGIARGASFDPDLEEQIGSCVAEQELACGITHILAPVLDISRDSRRVGREKVMERILLLQVPWG